MVNKALEVLAGATRTSTTESATFTNYDSKGLHVVINVTGITGLDTITPKIQGMVNSIYYDLLVGSEITATGITVLKVYPGISPLAYVSTSDALPLKWRFVMQHSAATNFSYSVNANTIP